MKDLVIIGSGGHGKDTAYVIERINAVTPQWNLIGFLDDNQEKWGTLVGKYQVIGGLKELENFDEIWAVCAIGNPIVRRTVVNRANGYKSIRWATVTDPSWQHSDSVEIGEGTIIASDVKTSVDIKIGKHVHLNYNTVVSHDSVVEDFCTMYVGSIAAGNTHLCEAVEVGMGARINQLLTVGRETIIGSGAVVVKNLPEKCTAVGVPAKPIKFRDKKYKDIVIIGCGGFGREVAWIIERANAVKKEWNILGFVDDSPEYQGEIVDGYPVLGTVEKLKDFDEVWCACGICTGLIRRKIVEKVNTFGNVKWATIIDPSCVSHETSVVGEGSILCIGTQININTKIGKHVVLIDRSAVGHDSSVGDYSILFVGAVVAGNVIVGESCELGMGSQTVQGYNIGAGTIVGGGAVVAKDLPEKCTAVGVPAKPIKFHE